MRHREIIKRGHEDAVLAKFIIWYNSETSMQYKIVERPKTPDALFKFNDDYLWVEHADIYRSGDEAHEEYSHATLGEIHYTHAEHPIFEPDRRTAIAFINTLEKKLKKKSYAEFYNKYGKGILLLTVRDPLFSESTLNAIIDEMAINKIQDDLGYFEKAYLGIRDGLFFLKIYPYLLI